MSFPCQRHRQCSSRHLTRIVPGNSPDLGLLDRIRTALRAVRPPEGVVLEQLLVEEGRRWSGVASTTSMVSSFDDMVQRGFGGRCGMMDAHRMVVLSGVVMA